MEQTFDMCQGCPFRGRPGFQSPAQFIYEKQLERNLVGTVRLVTPSEIRETTFPSVHNRVLEAIEKQEKADILLASPLGSGKTHSADQLAAEVARSGKSVLIAVPTADMAAEHKERIEAAGVSCHVLLSHENLFSKQKKHSLRQGFACPNCPEIQNLQKLGAGSSKIRERFCQSCPRQDECRYPGQYEKVGEPDISVVIIQHAHFRSPPAMEVLAKKKFSLLIVDEDFTGNCFTHLRPSKEETDLLRNLGYQWAAKLADWLTQGGYPDPSPIYPDESDLQELQNRAAQSKIDWNMVIGAYNRRHRAGRPDGLRIFHPVPDIPVRMFTDATPPIRMLKIILDNENIEVFGADEVIDILRCHPENKVISVLDQSVAKRQLGYGKQPDDFDEKFYDILNFIGDKCNVDHPSELVLITTYKSHIKETIRYLKPELP